MRTTLPSDTNRMLAAAAWWRGATPVVIGSLALLASGCGSSAHPPAAPGSPKDFASAAFKFSSCMRNHGLTNFPDPHVSSANGHVSVSLHVTPTDTSSPQFKAAQTACSGILPTPAQVAAQQAQQQQARARSLLAFATCLRGHGLTGFPDPTRQGQLTRQMISAAGIDLHAPGVLTAARACVGVSHGAITLADVERAVNGPH